MRVIYSRHLENRLSLRKVEYSLPKRIFEQSGERYHDEETKHLIATMEVELYGKNREVMVAYLFEDDCAKLITLHPLKKGQKENRLTTGRWRRL